MDAKQFINELAAMAGIAADNDSLAKITGVLNDIAVEDDFVNTMRGNLMTKEAAKNNSEIVGHIKQNTLEPIDNILKEFISGQQFTDEEKAPFSEKQKTYKNTKHLFDLMAGKYKHQLEELNKGVPDVEAIKTQYQQRLDAAFNEKEVLQADMNNLKSNHATKLKEFYLNSLLQGYDYSNGLNKEDGALLASHRLNNALTKEGVTLSGDYGNYQLMKGDLQYMPNNQPITLKEFADKTLAESKLLTVATPPTPTPQNGVRPQFQQQSEVKGMDAFNAKVAATQADYGVN